MPEGSGLFAARTPRLPRIHANRVELAQLHAASISHEAGGTEPEAMGAPRAAPDGYGSHSTFRRPYSMSSGSRAMPCPRSSLTNFKLVPATALLRSRLRIGAFPRSSTFLSRTPPCPATGKKTAGKDRRRYGKVTSAGLANPGRGRRWGAGRGIERRDGAKRFGGAIQETFDGGGELGAVRLFGLAGGGFGSQAGGQLGQLVRRDGADLGVGGRRGERHHAIHEDAFLGAADFGLVSGGDRRIESGLGQTVDDFFQAGQRGVHGMLGDHARGTVWLQYEADGHIGGDGGGAERVEPGARGARE